MSLYVKPEAYLLYGLHYVNDESHVKINLNRIFKNFKLPDYASEKLKKIYKRCLSEEFEDSDVTLKFYKHLAILDPNIGFEFVKVFLNNETKLMIVPFGTEYYNKYKICMNSGYGIHESLIDVDELNKVSDKKENDMKECYAWFKKYNIDIESEGFEFGWKLVSYIYVLL